MKRFLILMLYAVSVPILLSFAMLLMITWARGGATPFVVPQAEAFYLCLLVEGMYTIGFYIEYRATPLLIEGRTGIPRAAFLKRMRVCLTGFVLIFLCTWGAFLTLGRFEPPVPGQVTPVEAITFIFMTLALICGMTIARWEDPNRVKNLAEPRVSAQ